MECKEVCGFRETSPVSSASSYCKESNAFLQLHLVESEFVKYSQAAYIHSTVHSVTVEST